MAQPIGTKMEAKMADAHTPESAARVILEIFQSHGARPGGVVPPGALGQLIVAGSLSSGNADNGLRYGVTQGWFEIAPMGSLWLTKAGFAEI